MDQGIIIAVVAVIAVGVILRCAWLETMLHEAKQSRDYNARGWGEARDEANAFRRVLQVIADDDLDGNESLVAAKALGLTVPQDEAYLSAYFQRKPRTIPQAPVPAYAEFQEEPEQLSDEERTRVHRAFGGPHRTPQTEWTDNTEG